MRVLIFACALLAFAFWLDGYHFVRKPTSAQAFGCEKTYINDNGEDTGECG